MNQDPDENLRTVILEVLQAAKPGKALGSIGDDEDLFAQLGLNSMAIFSVLVQLEKKLRIVIGEDVTEFDRIQTFAGLHGLLTEKVRQLAPAPAADRGRES